MLSSRQQNTHKAPIYWQWPGVSHQIKGQGHRDHVLLFRSLHSKRKKKKKHTHIEVRLRGVGTRREKKNQLIWILLADLRQALKKNPRKKNTQNKKKRRWLITPLNILVIIIYCRWHNLNGNIQWLSSLLADGCDGDENHKWWQY